MDSRPRRPYELDGCWRQFCRPDVDVVEAAHGGDGGGGAGGRERVDGST